jgi:hypothetical protein
MSCLQIIVRELVGWVRNVVLMNVYWVGKNPGGSGFRPHGLEREMGSQFTSNPGTRWMDPVTARRVPSKWSRVEQGEQGEQGIIVYIQLVSSRVYNGMIEVIE